MSAYGFGCWQGTLGLAQAQPYVEIRGFLTPKICSRKNLGKYYLRCFLVFLEL